MDLYAVGLNAAHPSELDNYWIEFYWANDDEHAEEQAKEAHPHAAVLCTPVLVPAHSHPHRWRATFHPQAWINDYAVAVDPEGETSWDCTAYVAELGQTNPTWLDHTLANGLDDTTGSDHDDLLRQDPAAPEWVREWSGPFETEITRIVGGLVVDDSRQ